MDDSVLSESRITQDCADYTDKRILVAFNFFSILRTSTLHKNIHRNQKALPCSPLNWMLGKF